MTATCDSPCDRKRNHPPGPDALAAAARLLGAAAREVVVELALYADATRGAA